MTEADASPDETLFMTPQELIEVLGEMGVSVTKGALSQWRHQGKGPPFVKLEPTARGRVLYPRGEVRAWIIKTLSSLQGKVKADV
jgi:hypothetical protein